MAIDKEMIKKLVGVTPEFRGNYVTLLKPRAAAEGAEPKYSLVMALEKEHPFWKKLRAQIQLAAEQQFEGKVPKGFQSPIRDGDDVEYGDFGGKYFVQLSNRDQPEVIDKSRNPILERAKLYSGAWFQASYRVFAWNFKNMKRGASLSLRNVLWVRDDEAFAGRRSAAEDFAAFVDQEDDDPTA